jgi:outer membrane protein TolC
MGWGLGLQWAPPQPVVRSAKRAQARAHVEEVRQEIFEREWEVVAAVRLHYATAIEMAQQREPTNRAIETRRRLVAAIQYRMERGVSTRLELGLATLALSRALQERDEIDARYALAVRSLAGAIGVVSAASLKLQQNGDTGLPGVDAQVPESEELAHQALANRPLFRAAAARYDARSEGLRAEEAKRWPWIRLSAMPSYRYNYTADLRNDFTFGVDVVLPVFDLNTGPIAAADAARLEARDAFEAAVAAVRKDTALACTQLQARTAALKRFRDDILPTLDEHEKTLDSGFQGQQIDIAALLAAQDGVLRIRREHIEAQLQHHQAWVELARAVGSSPLAIVRTDPKQTP